MHADDTLAGRRRTQMQSSRAEREARERLAAACGAAACARGYAVLACMENLHTLFFFVKKFAYLVAFEPRHNPMKFRCLCTVCDNKFVVFLWSYTVFVLSLPELLLR